MLDDSLNYDEDHIAFLESMWGDGFLSPGGPQEVVRLLDSLDLTGLNVVDIGCGTGGIALSLARDFGAKKVIGLDVEAPVCAQARHRISEAGYTSSVEIREVEPGPMPLPDDSQDVVFSKDSIVHIPDKEALARDAYRVLKPGGILAASDWLISHDGEPSPEMAEYITLEDLDFGMASPRRYRAALEAAGFTDITLTNRNPWYRVLAKEEYARLQGPERPKFVAALGEDGVEHALKTWASMITVLDTGEHCPHHFRARKPE